MSETTYSQIPDYPQQYSAGAVLGRMVDGIGFRYRWATEGLSENDLSYKPCDSSRSISETLHHVHNLLEMVHTTITDQRYNLPEANKGYQFQELRQETLNMIAQISDQFKSASDDTIDEMSIKFKMGEQDLDFPMWNVINGPVSDILHHIGQIVGYRRASGNPIAEGVNPFIGQRMVEAA